MFAATATIASDAGAGPTKTQVTIWASPRGAYGGTTYGTLPPMTGAMITERRELEIAASGEARLANVATTADPASVQLRDLTEPTARVAEQRFVPAAATPTELIARHIGGSITVVTAKGDVTGVLRAADDHVIVLETGTGDQKRVSVMRRDGYVLDVRLPGGATGPSLAWKIATKQPGKHAIELTYRADGLSWAADYLAVLDEPGKQLDFNAWATVKNATGATFDAAELTLVTAAPQLAPTANAPGRPPGQRFTVPNAVKLGAGESVQVELLPTKLSTKVRSIVAFEAMPDPSAQHQLYPNQDCSQNNGSGSGSGRAEIALELDVPAQTLLPEGRVRLFQKRGARLEAVSEDTLRTAPGLARIRLAPDGEIVGERKAVSCSVDERAHTVVEKLETRVDNKGARPVDVVVREFLWRWPVWRLDAEDHRGVRAGPQTQEYRVRVPPKGSQTIRYSVVYTW